MRMSSTTVRRSPVIASILSAASGPMARHVRVQKARSADVHRAGSDGSVPKSSRAGLRHQKQPFVRQHFLKRWPEPHGQRSLRPSFSSSTLLPWTTCVPRLTCVSDGNPRRRLLIVSKKMVVRQTARVAWHTSFAEIQFSHHWTRDTGWRFAAANPSRNSRQRRPLLVDELDVVRDVVGDVGQQLFQRDWPGLGVVALSQEIFRPE